MVDDVKIILAEYRLALKKKIPYSMNNNIKYIGLIIVIILFGIFQFLKYMKELKTQILKIQIDLIIMRDCLI